MSKTLQVVRPGSDIRGFAKLVRDGIKYKGTLNIPKSISVILSDNRKSAAGTIGGAAVGGILAGGVGAVVGAIAGGNAGNVCFVVESISGKQLVLLAKSNEYPGIYATISDQINRASDAIAKFEAEIDKENGRKFSYLFPILLGPIYYLRFGLLWFICALVAFAATAGLAWLVLPFFAKKIAERRRGKKVQSLSRVLGQSSIPSSIAY